MRIHPARSASTIRWIVGKPAAVNGAGEQAAWNSDCRSTLKHCGAARLKVRKSAMRQLNDDILRLEICVEQIIIHLGSMRRDTGEAARAREELLTLLLTLRDYKERRERQEDGLGLASAA